MTGERGFRYGLWGALGALGLAALVAVAVGPAPLNTAQAAFSLLRGVCAGCSNGWGVELLPWQHTIVWQVRLPRVLVAMLVGASLAMCGAVLQGLFRNPLASPSVLGVSSGASLGAVLAIFFGLAAVSIWTLPLFAIVGAGATLAVVYGIASAGGQTPMATLLLAGVAVGAFNVAMSSLVLALALQQWEVGRAIVYWSMGGLEGRTWLHVGLLAPVCVLSLGVMLAYRRDLDILLVGEVHAASLGVDVGRARLNLLVATAVLTGTAVAVSGAIGFVGLVVPHIVRLLVGPHHRRVLPLSAVLGALVLVTADLALRAVFADNNIPTGVATAAMGAPFFLFLLLRQRREMRI